MDKYKARTMASKSVVAVLTASMTLGSFPIAAFAEPSDEIKAQAAALAQMAYANDAASDQAEPEAGLEEGKEYSVPVAFKKADGSGEDSMSGGFFQDKATVVANEGGTYAVTLTTKLTADQRGWMSDFKVGGQLAETRQVDDNNVSFTFTTDDISQAIEASVKVAPMGSSPSLLVVLDASKAEEVKPAEADKTALNEAIASAQKVEQGNKTDEAYQALQGAIASAQKVAGDEAATQDAVDAAAETLKKAVETFNASEDAKPSTDPYEAGYKLYYKAADATAQFGRSFESKVKVVPQTDGTYVVELTAKTLGDKGQLGDVTLAGQAVKYADHEDGSRTYELPVKDVKGTVNFTFGYTAGTYNANHPFQLVLDGGEYAGIAGFVDEQISVAEAALKAGENKTDEAKAALQKVIDAAKAATDDATRSTALNSLITAINTFKASADKPAEAYESAYQIYYKGADATDQYVTGDRASFNDKVRVVPQADGTYVVELTAKSLGDAGKLADVKVDGQAVKYADHEDGSRTYELPVKDAKGTTDFTFGYTVSYGGSEHTNEHPFQLVLAGGTYSGYTATKAFLDEQIASAKRKLAASKKDDAANEAYQKAIDAAQAVSDKEGATPAEYGKAVQDLDAATKAFNAAPDKPTAPTVEAGKVYTATGTFYDESGTNESTSMKGFFKPEVEVRKAADGTYEVDVKTIDAGVATAYGLSVSSGFDSTESDVVYSEAKGDNTVATYRLTGDDLGNIKVHVGYDAGVYKGSHNLVLKVDAASVKEEAVDKAALTDAIAKVPADKGSKTDEAFATLTAAKDAAQKVADQADATTGDVAAAVAALKKAVEDFKASEDAKPEAGLEEGKEYSVPVAFKKADGSGEDSMSGGFFQDKATVVANEGGTYAVTLTTKLTADQRGWMSDFTVGGQLAETRQVDENNVSFTFTTDDISQAIEASVKVAPMGSSPSLLVVLDASKAEEVKPEPAEKADTSKLEAAIKEAQSIKQGNKTDKAFKALQDAIADAQEVVKAGHTKDEQSVVDKATDALNAAIKTFNSSANKPSQPDTPDTSTWKAGHTYEIPLSVWMNNNIDGATVNMTRYYSTTGVLEVAKDGTLDFHFTILAPDKFQGLQYGGKDVQPELVDGKAVYHLKVSESELNNTTGIETRMRIDAMGGWFTMNIRTDTSKAKDVTETGGNGGTTTPDAKGDVKVEAGANGSVTVDRQEAAKGETVTLTPKADEGYHVSSIKVTDKDGGAVAYAYRADGTFSFEMPEGQATVRVEFARDAAKAFSDVDASMWQAAGVDFVSSRGIMSGYQNADGTDSGTFGVGDELTRGQFATLLHNHAQPGLGDAKADNETGLPDVLGGQYYTDSVNWAVANKVINGYEGPDGGRTFGADDPVTLEQMVTIIANLKGADVTGADLSVLGRFVDGDAVSEWARPYVAWAVQTGLVSGSVEADGLRVRPTEAITRGRVATVLMNAFQTGVLK